MQFKLIIIISVIFHWFNVAALDFPYKCSMKNSTCQHKFYQAVARSNARSGIPEIGVPPLNPFHLKDVRVPFMEFLDATLVEGDCIGIGTCKLLHYESNLDNFHKVAVIQCEKIVIQGSYIISTNPYFTEILGNVSGSGNGSIVLEEWHFKFDFPFSLTEHSDGEIYTAADFENGTYVSEVLKKVTVTADSITVDGKDVTENVLEFLNKYWRIILGTFGEHFHKKSVDFYYEMYTKFFNNIPANKYLSDDLVQYLPYNLKIKKKVVEE